jgi:hypothetical protein
LLEVPAPDIALVEVIAETIDGETFGRKPPQGVAFGSRQLKGQSRSLDRGDLYNGLEIRKFAAS